MLTILSLTFDVTGSLFFYFSCFHRKCHLVIGNNNFSNSRRDYVVRWINIYFQFSILINNVKLTLSIDFSRTCSIFHFNQLRLRRSVKYLIIISASIRAVTLRGSHLLSDIFGRSGAVILVCSSPACSRMVRLLKTASTRTQCHSIDPYLADDGLLISGVYRVPSEFSPFNDIPNKESMNAQQKRFFVWRREKNVPLMRGRGEAWGIEILNKNISKVYQNRDTYFGWQISKIQSDFDANPFWASHSTFSPCEEPNWYCWRN